MKIIGEFWSSIKSREKKDIIFQGMNSKIKILGKICIQF